MQIINASYKILTPISQNGVDELHKIEQIGRLCYKSEDKMTETSAAKFVEALIKRGHEAMIEHSQLSVIFTVDRGVSHEMVRHRLASFAQESTRYCNYSKEKFGNEITVIKPFFLEQGTDAYDRWEDAMEACEASYFDMLKCGCSPQEARSVLPNSLKTEIAITANYREWRQILRLRTAKDAHPQMREVMCALGDELQEKLSVIFGRTEL